MSNYSATSLSNWFRVKDVAAFIEAMTKIEVQVFNNKHGEPDQVSMYAVTDHGTWPYSVWDDDAEDSVDVDILAIIAEHLVEGSVATLIEVGHEGVRYAGGIALAVNSAGETRKIDLNDISTLGKELGTEVLY